MRLELDQRRTREYGFNRRRFLSVVAASVGALAMGPAVFAEKIEPQRWQGRLLGAEAEIILYHHGKARAEAAVLAAVAEVRRLESLFSLYDPSSQLSRLNRDGSLADAATDFLQLLNYAQAVWNGTNGLFDPSVQPLFELYADSFAKGKAPSAQQISRTLNSVGLEHVSFENGKISFGKTGMALTLNGIAQGFITDKAHDILKAHGFGHALVNMGEFRALGAKENGDSWQIGIADANAPWSLFDQISLSSGAVATSAPGGAAFDNEGNYHHLLHPKRGISPSHYLSVTVKAPTATLADALSTSLALVPPAEVHTILSRFENVSALLRPSEGAPVRINL